MEIVNLQTDRICDRALTRVDHFTTSPIYAAGLSKTSLFNFLILGKGRVSMPLCRRIGFATQSSELGREALGVVH